MVHARFFSIFFLFAKSGAIKVALNIHRAALVVGTKSVCSMPCKQYFYARWLNLLEGFLPLTACRGFEGNFPTPLGRDLLRGEARLQGFMANNVQTKREKFITKLQCFITADRNRGSGSRAIPPREAWRGLICLQGR